MGYYFFLVKVLLAGCLHQWNTVRVLLLWLLRPMKDLIIREFTLSVSANNFMQLQHFIIWQDSLEINLNVLIGSLLDRFLPYGPFRWKWA